MAAAFEAAKVAYQAATLLVYPNRQAELALMVDALAEHVGATLQQRTAPAGAWQPLGFFSKKLDTAQTRYSAYDQKLLACVLGIPQFRYMLEGVFQWPQDGGGPRNEPPV